MVPNAVTSPTTVRLPLASNFILFTPPVLKIRFVPEIAIFQLLVAVAKVIDPSVASFTLAAVSLFSVTTTASSEDPFLRKVCCAVNTFAAVLSKLANGDPFYR